MFQEDIHPINYFPLFLLSLDFFSSHQPLFCCFLFEIPLSPLFLTFLLPYAAIFSKRPYPEAFVSWERWKDATSSSFSQRGKKNTQRLCFKWGHYSHILSPSVLSSFDLNPHRNLHMFTPFPPAPVHWVITSVCHRNERWSYTWRHKEASVFLHL